MRTTAAVRQNNRQSVLREIYCRGPVSRVGLVAPTGLTATAISRITRELIDIGLLREGEQQSRNGVPGRRETELFISDRVARVLAVSLHVDDRSIVLADIRGRIVDRVDLDIPFSENQENVVEHVADLALQLVARNRLDPGQVLGLAISVAGKIDPANGILTESRVYRWRNVPIRQILQTRTGLPVAIENLNNSINLSETRFGLAQERCNVLLLRVGTGLVGASMIVDGHLLRGHRFGAGLIHHLPIAVGERLCECGRRGCVNAAASGLGILANYEDTEPVALQAGDPPPSNARIIALLQQAEQGDERVRRILRDAGRALGRGLLPVVETLCPDTILVAGKVGRSTFYYEGLMESLSRYANAELLAAIDIMPTSKSVLQATIDLSIDSFLLSTDLDPARLRRVANAGEAA